MLKILSITILRHKAKADMVVLHTDLKEGCYPYENDATFRTDVAFERGESWVRENFSEEIPVKIIHV